MWLFRRRDLSDDELREIAEHAARSSDVGIATEIEKQFDLPPGAVQGRVKVDRFELRADRDGKVHEHCWFCGGEMLLRLGHEGETDVALMTIEPIGDGDPVHGACHRACADRARGSLPQPA